MSRRTSSSIGSAVRPVGEPLDQLRRVGAAAADDGDLQAHRPSLVGCPSRGLGLDNGRRLSKLLITLSATSRRHDQRWHDGDASDSSSGPVPLHHQVYLDLRAALDAANGAPATGCRPSATWPPATAAA